jgi:hypothetical protein
LLSEEEKAEPCGAGMLALFPLMCCFSSLYKNQRLYSPFLRLYLSHLLTPLVRLLTGIYAGQSYLQSLILFSPYKLFILLV